MKERIIFRSNSDPFKNFVSLPHFTLNENICKWIEEHNKTQKFYQVYSNGYYLFIGFNDEIRIEIEI